MASDNGFQVGRPHVTGASDDCGRGERVAAGTQAPSAARSGPPPRIGSRTRAARVPIRSDGTHAGACVDATRCGGSRMRRLAGDLHHRPLQQALCSLRACAANYSSEVSWNRRPWCRAPYHKAEEMGCALHVRRRGKTKFRTRACKSLQTRCQSCKFLQSRRGLTQSLYRKTGSQFLNHLTDA